MLRVVFMGSPDFAVPTLRAILSAGHRVAAVYTQPPRPAGRGLAPRKGPVQRVAEVAGLRVLTPVSLKGSTEQDAFIVHRPDVAVVVAYGLILPAPMLRAPREGCLNLHASDLPRWRGAAPIQRAIMAGDDSTAACVMRMDEGLDTGPVCARERVPIGPDMTAGDLHDALAARGAALMVNALDRLGRGTLDCTPQARDGITYAAKIGKDETRLDFTRQAREVHDHIRALSPVPGAWFAVPDGAERIRVLRSRTADAAQAPAGTVLDASLTVACGSGAVQLLELQRAGKRPVSAADFLRGYRLPPGTRLQAHGH
jgi:methionyl-tRNA formyltransferase